MLVEDAELQSVAVDCTEPHSIAVDCAEPCSLVIELRRQAHYWRAMHARAVQREAVASAKVQQLEQIVRDQQTQIADLTRQLEALKAKVAWLQQQVFGRKSEQTLDAADQACAGAADARSRSHEYPNRRYNPPLLWPIVYR